MKKPFLSRAQERQFFWIQKVTLTPFFGALFFALSLTSHFGLLLSVIAAAFGSGLFWLIGPWWLHLTLVKTGLFNALVERENGNNQSTEEG